MSRPSLLAGLIRRVHHVSNIKRPPPFQLSLIIPSSSWPAFIPPRPSTSLLVFGQPTSTGGCMSSVASGIHRRGASKSGCAYANTIRRREQSRPIHHFGSTSVGGRTLLHRQHP